MVIFFHGQTRPPKAITTEYGAWPHPFAFFFIRTLTVGSGVSLDLLTPRREAARGLMGQAHLPPVGNFAPP
jgi:hypothetical protein